MPTSCQQIHHFSPPHHCSGFPPFIISAPSCCIRQPGHFNRQHLHSSAALRKQATHTRKVLNCDAPAPTLRAMLLGTVLTFNHSIELHPTIPSLIAIRCHTLQTVSGHHQPNRILQQTRITLFVKNPAQTISPCRSRRCIARVTYLTAYCESEHARPLLNQGVWQASAQRPCARAVLTQPPNPAVSPTRNVWRAGQALVHTVRVTILYTTNTAMPTQQHSTVLPTRTTG